MVNISWKAGKAGHRNLLSKVYIAIMFNHIYATVVDITLRGQLKYVNEQGSIIYEMQFTSKNCWLDSLWFIREN